MKGSGGFTLMELMATIAIVGILLAMGVPSYSRFAYKGTRAKGSTELYAAMVTARSEAIARNAPVTVCRRDYYAGGSFPKCAAGSSGTWAQGWIVYQDADNSFSSSEPNNAADIIGVYDPIGETSPTSSTDAFNVVTTLTFPAYLVFQANGRTASSVSFILCDRLHRLPDARRVDVALSGGVSLSEVSSTDAATACA